MAEEMPDELAAFLAEECQDAETSWIYGYHFGWNDARNLPWWKRLLMRRLSFIADHDWPGVAGRGPDEGASS